MHGRTQAVWRELSIDPQRLRGVQLLRKVGKTDTTNLPPAYAGGIGQSGARLPSEGFVLNVRGVNSLRMSKATHVRDERAAEFQKP